MIKLFIDPYTREGKVEGYSYLIEKEGEIIATGYYTSEIQAQFYGQKALNIYEEASK